MGEAEQERWSSVNVLKQRLTDEERQEINGLARIRLSYIQGLGRINPEHADGGVKCGVHFKRGMT